AFDLPDRNPVLPHILQKRHSRSIARCAQARRTKVEPICKPAWLTLRFPAQWVHSDLPEVIRPIEAAVIAFLHAFKNNIDNPSVRQPAQWAGSIQMIGYVYRTHLAFQITGL